MFKCKIKEMRFSLLIFIGFIAMFSSVGQGYYFIADYGIFSDKYEELNSIETYVDSFEYKLDVPLRDGMLLKFDLGVEWDDIDKTTRRGVSAIITRPYDPPLRMIKMDKVKFSGSKKLKSMLFKGMFRSGSKLVRINMYIPLPKK